MLLQLLQIYTSDHVLSCLTTSQRRFEPGDRAGLRSSVVRRSGLMLEDHQGCSFRRREFVDARRLIFRCILLLECWKYLTIWIQCWSLSRGAWMFVCLGLCVFREREWSVPRSYEGWMERRFVTSHPPSLVRDFSIPFSLHSASAPPSSLHRFSSSPSFCLSHLFCLSH